MNRIFYDIGMDNGYVCTIYTGMVDTGLLLFLFLIIDY